MRTITVSGVGNISIHPDYVTLFMVIKEISKDYAYAMTCAAKQLDLLRSTVEQSGYAKEELKTVSFCTESRLERFCYNREFIAYVCMYQLRLSFDFDGERLMNVISSIAATKAKIEITITFTVKDRSTINERLLISAAENARSKAEILCRTLGCTLGSLVNINCDFDEYDLPSEVSYTFCDRIAPDMAMSTPPINPDDINVSKSVSFTWELI